jgi:Acyl-coenzyme A synthetases/AMP-(fatty) acid ligases
MPILRWPRIGAIHSVVFGGFNAESLRAPIKDAEASVVITADGGYRKGAVFLWSQRLTLLWKEEELTSAQS